MSAYAVSLEAATAEDAVEWHDNIGARLRAILISDLAKE